MDLYLLCLHFRGGRALQAALIARGSGFEFKPACGSLL